MRAEDFERNSPGRLVKTPEGAWAFVPDPLPPRIEPTNELMEIHGEARAALGELSGVGRHLPDPALLIRPFWRKEAQASNRIEGTETDLDELFVHEADPNLQPKGAEDRKEVLNYVVALERGMEISKELPVCLRMVEELHGVLMQGVRGQSKAPGEFRRVQNRIGGSSVHDAVFVPPPPPEMRECLSGWEKFLHSDSKILPLIKLALAHYQLEAIHPFLDGNGRAGRLLIPILLCEWGLLRQPLLYLSAYFDRNRRGYYDLLLSVSQQGNWGDWVLFFLRGIEEQAKDAVWRAGKLMDKREEYRLKMQAKGPVAAVRLADETIASPVWSSSKAARQLGITQPTALYAIQKMEEAGILKEITGRQRGRLWIAPEILEILSAENE